MALKIDWKKQVDGFSGELVSTNSYAKVSTVSGDKSMAHCSVDILSEDQSKRIDTFGASFSPNMDGSNFIKQAYEHLKTLPEFAGAADV